MITPVHRMQALFLFTIRAVIVILCKEIRFLFNLNGLVFNGEINGRKKSGDQCKNVWWIRDFL